MKRVLAVIAVVFAALAAWVFLRTGSGAPEQPARDREQPRPVAAQPPRVEPPPAETAASAPTPRSGASASAPAGRELVAPSGGRPAGAAPAQQAGAPSGTDRAASPAKAQSDAVQLPVAASPSGAPLPVEAPEGPVRSGAIAGAVLDARGAPIAGATILALAPDATDGTETFTDDEGEFVLPGLSPRRYAVFAGLGTPLAPRLGSRGVQVRSTAVTRLDLREPTDAAQVRVVATDAAGRPVDGEAILVRGLPPDAGDLGSVLASDAIYLPERRDGGSRLRVPPGTYTVVVLQHAGAPARTARAPIRVTGAPLDVNVELSDAPVVKLGYASDPAAARGALALP